MGLLRGWNNPTNYWSGSGGHILVSHPWAIPHGYLMLQKLRPHRWTNVTHEQPTLTYLVDKVVVFQGTNNAMTVTTEVFGQLKHINNWCFTFLVASYTNVYSDIHAAETKTITERQVNVVLFSSPIQWNSRRYSICIFGKIEHDCPIRSSPSYSSVLLITMTEVKMRRKFRKLVYYNYYTS